MKKSKPTLFISYCQSDGYMLAEDLENELSDNFSVKRDKSQLIPNDDIYEFMAGIANEDYVIIVLTQEYVKSRNCMLEMAYLAMQEDWSDKTTVLVIDESIYSSERKLEILNYWLEKQRDEYVVSTENESIGRSIIDEDIEYINLINSILEDFLKGISRRLNPSQIMIVNEMVRKLKKKNIADYSGNAAISRGEQLVKEYLEKNGSKTMAEISKEIGCSKPYTSRMVRRLLDTGQIQAYDTARYKKYYVEKQ